MGIIDFIQKHADEDQARAFVERIVWKEGRYCPHCDSTHTNGIKRKNVYNGLYQCRDCRKQFTVTTKTIFHATKIPLSKWLTVLFLMADSSKGMSANKISQWLDLPYKTTWHMCHRIRAAMTEGDDTTTALTGVVELDETYVGGKPRFGVKNEDGTPKHNPRGRGTEKQGVFVAVERGGEVSAELISGHGVKDLKPLVNRFVAPSATLMTDELPAYKSVGRDYRFHHVVYHASKEYAREGDIHSNTAESFNSTIKRAVVGVFHFVSKKHMIRYVNEICFRWNTRWKSAEDRVEILISRTLGKRLPLDHLIS